MRLYGLLGESAYLCAKYVAKKGGQGGMLPREILVLDLSLDAIWWNLGLFLHKHNLSFIVSLKLL